MTADDLLQKHKDAVNACVSWKLGEITQNDAAKVEAEFRRCLLGHTAPAIPEGWQVVQEVIDAARDMPRATPAPGGSSTEHDFKIAAHAVWRLDRALKKLDATPTPPVAPWNAAIEAAVACVAAQDLNLFGLNEANRLALCTMLRALTQPDAVGVGEAAAIASLRDMIRAIESGSIDSPEIGEPESGIPYHKWHDEWLHHARAALAGIRG